MPVLRTRLATVTTAVNAGQANALALQRRSASAYESVKTNIKGATDLLALAKTDLDFAARGALPGAAGPDRGAGTLAAGRAAGRLDKIGVLLDAIKTMTNAVETATTQLPAHLRNAAAEIAKAARADTNNDVQGEERTISVAQKDLDQAQTLVDADPYQAEELAMSALTRADAVLEQVRDAVEARQRQEAAAQEAYRKAQRAVEQADSYIKSNKSVVSGAARRKLAAAQQSLQQYPSGMSVAQMVAAMVMMQGIQRDAQKAYDDAQNDVSAHEASEDSYSSHDSYHGGHGSGSSYDSGGSSSGGSWGGGGGISSGGSFGGGGGISAGGGW